MEAAAEALDGCLESLLASLEGPEPLQPNALDIFYEHVTALKEHFLARLEATNRHSLRQEIEQLKTEYKHQEALLKRYETFIASWKTRLDDMDTTHTVNINDFKRH